MTAFEDICLDGVTVAIGIPVDNPVPALSMVSFCQTMRQCTAMGIRCELIVEMSGIVQWARDKVLDSFLTKSTAQKLFWIDSDMVWTPAEFLRLLAISTKVDVVGASYPAKVTGAPTYYVSVPEDRKTGPFGTQEVTGMGLGFTVVDRGVCEKLAAASPRVEDAINKRELASVFRVDTVNGKRRSEDFAFFADIKDAGYTVWMDPSIELGHIGECQWRGRFMDVVGESKNGVA